jgi:enhancing lycopene biosynthesis protein 2
MCISPVILARLFKAGMLTTGNDKASADFIKKMGGEYIEAPQGKVIIDKERRFFTTPCYMLDASILDIAESAENLVAAIMRVI